MRPWYNARMSKRPNVIWIFGDQHRGQALGCAGDPNARTPHLDRLATDGLRFTRAVAGSPLCCPFRGSLLAGRYPHACVPGHQYPLPPDMPTIAHAFRDAGYHTAYVGKWHLDGFNEYTCGRGAMHIVPPERRGGFDHWIGYENNNAQYDCYVHGDEGDDAFHYKLDGYETDCLTDLFIDHLRQPTDRPFFAVLSVQPPHIPYVAPDEYMQRYDPAKIALRPNVPNVERIQREARQDLAGYYAMIENLDHNVGRIRDALEQTGLADSTVVMFFSDHGDMHGSQGLTLKCMPWAESISIPLIIAGPGVERGVCDTLVNHVDMAPTTLGLCGIDAPPAMDGIDVLHSPAPDSAYLQLVEPGLSTDRERPWRGIITADGWLYAALEGQPWLLYNHNEDPYELANLALDGRFRDERRRLQDRLAQWINQTGDHFRLPTV